MEKKQRMRISELEKLAGVPRSTIHYYIREGILHPSVKTGRTMGYYDENHLKRLLEIKRIKTEYQNMKTGKRVPRHALDQPHQKKAGQAEPGDHDSLSAKSKEAPTHPRKQEIINAAIQLFSQKGYHHTNIRDITRAIGISKGTFYLYYSSKRDLFVEVVDDVLRNIIGDIAQAIKKEDDLLKRTVLRARVFNENYSKYSEILSQLRAEMASEDEWAQKKVKKVYHDLTMPLIREAEEAIRRGVIREVDPDLLAYSLIGMTEILSLRMNLDDKYSFEQTLEFLFNFIMKGLDST